MTYHILTARIERSIVADINRIGTLSFILEEERDTNPTKYAQDSKCKEELRERLGYMEIAWAKNTGRHYYGQETNVQREAFEQDVMELSSRPDINLKQETSE